MSDFVLVTGGLGMMGAPVCESLILAGYRVVVYDIGSDRSLLSSIQELCDFVHGDADDLTRLISTVQAYKPVAIVHFAAIVGSIVENQPWSGLRVNLMGSVSVLECARLSGVKRVILASSKSVYGPVPSQYKFPHFAPVTESLPREPLNHYGKLKRAVEDIASHYAELYNLDVCAFRFGTTFGPAPVVRHRAFIANMIESAFEGSAWKAEQGADQLDDLCYSGEAGAAVISALTSKPIFGSFRAYNISSGKLISLRAMIEVLSRFNPRWEVKIGDGLDYKEIGDAYYFQMDLKRSALELSYEPKYSFLEAIENYYSIFSRVGEHSLYVQSRTKE